MIILAQINLLIALVGLDKFMTDKDHLIRDLIVITNYLGTELLKIGHVGDLDKYVFQLSELEQYLMELDQLHQQAIQEALAASFGKNNP